MPCGEGRYRLFHAFFYSNGWCLQKEFLVNFSSGAKHFLAELRLPLFVHFFDESIVRVPSRFYEILTPDRFCGGQYGCRGYFEVYEFVGLGERWTDRNSFCSYCVSGEELPSAVPPSKWDNNTNDFAKQFFPNYNEIEKGRVEVGEWLKRRREGCCANIKGGIRVVKKCVDQWCGKTEKYIPEA